MGYYNDYDDYDDFGPDEDEMEVADSMSGTSVEQAPEQLVIKFDTKNFASGIIQAVANSLRETLRDEIMNEIKKDILGDMKATISDNVNDITRELLVEIYEGEKIKIGGGWGEEPKEYTIKQYIMESIKNSFSDGEVQVRVEDRYGAYKTKKVPFTEWVTSECVSPEIEKHIDKQMKKVKDEINSKVKSIFDDSTRKMLSENVLNILMANDTYKKIESNIANIATRAE